MSNQIESFMKGILVGGVIGAAIGILYAPKSGRETREDINRKAEKVLKKAKEEYESALRKSNKAYEAAVKQLKHVESETKERMGEMEDKLNELAELGKETLHDTKGSMTKVVDAAVHAFKH
jgi:gas vesicle protein